MKIELSENIKLDDAEAGLFLKIFPECKTILIHFEYTEGFGDSRVFRVSRINSQGEYNLFVVKISSNYWIKREWLAYKNHIPKRLVGFTEIYKEPILGPDNLGGICYPLVGHGKFKVENLLDYCLNNNSLQIIDDVLEDELYENLQFLWANVKLVSNYSFFENYDHLLPHYLEIHEVDQSNNPSKMCTPGQIRDEFYSQGEIVSLSGFVVTSVTGNLLSLSLNDNNLSPYKVKFKALENSSIYTIGQKLLPSKGIIHKTRIETLQNQAQSALGENWVVEKDFLISPQKIRHPNPINKLTEVLQSKINVRQSNIHGDLRMANILVEYFEKDEDEKDHIAHLIDFDHSRFDHVLRDHFRFETDVITKLLYRSFVSQNLTSEDVYEFCRGLHKSVVLTETYKPNANLEKPFKILYSMRMLAKNYLYSPSNWVEYYQGLLIYLVGVLKFKDLNFRRNGVSPQALAFLYASQISEYLE